MSHAASLALSAVLVLPFAADSRLIGRSSQSKSAQADRHVEDHLESVDRLLLPEPLAEPSSPIWRRLKIVTGGDAALVSDSQLAVRNQKAYAKQHDYAHEVHVGNYAYPWIGYWHKIDVLLRELRQPNPPEIVVWTDLDVLITNPYQAMFEDILAAHPEKDVILTEDALRGDPIPGVEQAQRFVNTGIIIVRNTAQAMRVLEELFQFGRSHRNAAYLPQATDTLHEQDAFNSLLSGARKHVWLRLVAVIPQRSGRLNLNTFARSSYDTHYQDASDVEWSTGDFTAHCTGLRKQFRERCIKDSIIAAEMAVAVNTTCSDIIGDLDKQMYILPHL